MFLYLLAGMIALLLIFGLGYGSPVLGSRFHNPFVSTRPNLGPVNVRSQNNNFFTSNTSSHNSFIGDYERDSCPRGLESLHGSSVENGDEVIPEDTLRAGASNSRNPVSMSFDCLIRDEREKELPSYGGVKFYQAATSQNHTVRIAKQESNRENILQALRSSIYQNAVLSNSKPDIKSQLESGSTMDETTIEANPNIDKAAAHELSETLNK